MPGVGSIFRPLLVIFALAVCGKAAPADYALTVDVTLSPKAAVLLKSRNEAVAVMANYYGDPIPAKMYLNTDEGGIGIGTEFVTIAGAGRAAIAGTEVMAGRVGWVKSIMVLINVTSARHADRNNLLDCDVFEDTLAKARARPIAIFCRLIGERAG